MKRKVQEIYDYVLWSCRPNNDKKPFEEAFESFFRNGNTHNFIGGNNDYRNTLHENLFNLLMGNTLQQQVHFGTGKGGYEKWMTKRYTADFYDEENNVIYEIDGDNHKTELQKLKDQLRDIFFAQELGIKTVRITNARVEEILKEELVRKYESGAYDEIFEAHK